MNERMIILPATLRKIDGPRVTGEYVLQLDVPQNATEKVAELMLLGEKSLVLTISPAMSDAAAIPLLTETPTDKRKRYIAKVHAQLREVASNKKLDVEQVKEMIKKTLKKEGKLEDSLADLSTAHLLEVIDRLDRVLMPAESYGPEEE